ncbi:MAG: molybdate ABC transporter substrate-binding protein [Alphaproteobacteria bacterium]|nr:MAG: molybdate ABC transporter substrate-binding protein [Alphaproteobacteria bacterium]
MWRALAGLLVLLVAAPAWAEPRLLMPASMARLSAALEKAYHEAHPDEELTIIVGATSLLARQVEQGIDAHVIITANQQWMDYLGHRALIDPASRRAYLENSLVVVTPSNNREDAFDFMALAQHVNAKRLLALCGPGPVPCGTYARDALVKAGLWDRLEPHIVYGQDAAAVRHWVERGSVAYAILYKSDLADNIRVRGLAIVPNAFTGRVIYEIAAIAGRPPRVRQRVLDFLASPAAAAIIEAGGFLMKTSGLP